MNKRRYFGTAVAVFFCLGLFAQTPAVAPATAFIVPTAADTADNPQYWQGYAAGELVPVPLPEGSAYSTLGAYDVVIAAMDKSSTNCVGVQLGSVCLGLKTINNYNVGYNEALWDAANYFWLNDPKSCHNVVCQ